ncbi:hypothetical protein [Clostridium septicum]|nr:hypothetical protein [Clostridium septicum]
MNAMKYWGENIQNIILGLGFTNGSNIIGSFNWTWNDRDGFL